MPDVALVGKGGMRIIHGAPLLSSTVVSGTRHGRLPKKKSVKYIPNSIREVKRHEMAMKNQ